VPEPSTPNPQPPTPKPQTPNPNPQATAAGHTLLVDVNSIVYAFGCNTQGQLGVNSTSPYEAAPLEVTAFKGMMDAVVMVRVARHTLHVTRHTSRVTRHTSRVMCRTLHVTCDT